MNLVKIAYDRINAGTGRASFKGPDGIFCFICAFPASSARTFLLMLLTGNSNELLLEFIKILCIIYKVTLKLYIIIQARSMYEHLKCN